MINDEAAAAPAVPPLSGLQVLIADDSPDNRLLLQRMLRSSGAAIKVVGNGAEALQAAMQNHYDVLLMDIQMPVMDGLTATAELRRRGYDRPIVALTAHAMREERERCLRAGCNDHLSKPISAKGLLQAIARHAGRDLPQSLA